MNDTWRALLREAAAIHLRFAAVDAHVMQSCRIRRRGQFIGAIAVILGVFCFAFQQASEAQVGPAPLPDIVCNSVKIVSDQGRDQVTLGHDQISGFVKVHAPDGSVRSSLWTDARGQWGQLNLFDDKLKSRVSLAGNISGGSASFNGQNENRHIYIGSAAGDAGSLSLHNGTGQTLVHLGQDSEGGLVFVNGHDGGARASLWVAKGGKHGLLHLHDQAGKSRVKLGLDAEGGYLDLHGNNDKAQVMLDCDGKTGGALRLFTPTGGKLFYVGPHQNGNGQLQLFGTDGVLGVDVFVNADDEGMVWGIDGANKVTRWLK